MHFWYLPRVLTISVCIPKAKAFRSWSMDLEDRPKHSFLFFVLERGEILPTTRKMKHYAHYMPYNDWPEQHHVSRRAPTGRNKGPQCRQSHVNFEYAITVTLPGALTKHCGHVHAWRHHLANAGTVMKHLMNQDTVMLYDCRLSCFHRMIFEELMFMYLLSICIFLIWFHEVVISPFPCQCQWRSGNQPGRARHKSYHWMRKLGPSASLSRYIPCCIVTAKSGGRRRLEEPLSTWT